MIEYELALRKNIATNGRWFCAGLAAVNVAAGSATLAAISLIPIGASCVVDQLPNGKLSKLGALATYALAALVCVITILF